MSKTLVVYFTTTGNTQMLAESIAEGIGSDVVLKNVSDATADEVSEYDVIALGCPACGTEELDDTEFEPFFEEALPNLAGKKVALFGCYGWGDGEFMRTWEERVKDGGAELIEEGFLHLETPDEEALANAKAYGERIGNA